MAEPAELALDALPAGTPLPSMRELDLGAGQSMTLCWIPPGASWIGSRDRPYAAELTAFKLRVERGFWLGSTAVTRGQWRAIRGDVPEPGFEDMDLPDRHPVVNVSWFEALQFCADLQARFLPEVPAPVGPLESLVQADDCSAVTWSGGVGFRLPSECEWEYACRGAGRLARGLAETPFGDGEEVFEQRAWYMGNSTERTHPVDRAPEENVLPHPLGLRQVIGNVNEWCLDLYRAERWAELRPGRGQAAHGRRPADSATLSEAFDALRMLRLAEAGELGSTASREILTVYRDSGGQKGGLEGLQAALNKTYSAGGRQRVLRGGSWDGTAADAASAYRGRGQPVVRVGGVGFRVCLSPRPKTEAGPERRRTGPVKPGGARSGADPCADAEAGGQQEA